MFISLTEEQRLRATKNSDEVKGDWRKLYDEEVGDLCFSPNIISLIKSRRIRWAEHEARVRIAKLYEILSESPRDRGQSEDLKEG